MYNFFEANILFVIVQSTKTLPFPTNVSSNQKTTCYAIKYRTLKSLAVALGNLYFNSQQLRESPDFF